MRQAVLVETKHIEFREVEAPKASDLKEHQVLLNIKRIGICGSEIHSYHGCHPATFYPVVQGHEYSAVVVATGAAVTICKVGDVVTARPQLACGKCKPCQRGEYNICEELRVQAFQANGAAQDFFVVDDDRVAVLPEGMSLDYGAMIEPVAVAAHATMRGGDLKGKNVVVSGAGTIGNLVAQFAKARGAKRVLITDVSDFRLEIARKCGITVPDFKLMDGKYFATKRFDIENGIRYHIATAGALLNESIMQPRLDYKTLLHLVGYLTQDPKQVDEMFRRMVFNVLTDNKDDHAKNFSFIYKEGNWALAPAYDLTRCNNGYNGEHATSVNNHGNPTIEDMLIVGESIRIPRKKGKEMILTIAEGCAELLSKDYSAAAF